MQSGPFCDRPVYHIEMRDVKKKFSGLFAGKVPYKLLIKFAAVFARPLDPVLACLRFTLLSGHLSFLLFAL